MATVYWHDGFELYTSITHLGRAYTLLDSDHLLDTSIYRTGAQAIRFRYEDRGIRWIKPSLGAATMVLGFGFRISSLYDSSYDRKTMVLIDDAANIVLRFCTETTGKLKVYRSSTLLGTTSDPVMSTTGFNFIEIKVYAHGSDGTVEIRLNGDDTPVLSLSGINTIESGTVIEGFELRGVHGPYNWYDDVYFATDFLGDSKVVPIRVTGAGNYSQFTPSAGNNEDNVDESPGPDDDTTYNDGDAVDEIDTYEMGDIVSGGAVHALKIQGHYKKTDVGTAKMKQALRINGSDYLGAEKTLTTDYTCEHDMFNVNPDDSEAFTASDINALELGARVTGLS